MRLVATLLLLGLGGAAAHAQPPTPEQIDQALEAYRRILVDWGSLTRYGSENAELRPQAGRVVFLGDEITENWGPEFFPGKPYLNRGIIRQTTPQMLVRFRQDVIALKPAVVVIQAGTNDLASVMGPSTPAQWHPRRTGFGYSGLRLLHEDDGTAAAGQNHRFEWLDQRLRQEGRCRLFGLLLGAGRRPGDEERVYG
ncbi:MAG: hypothetical protein NTV52_29910 [Acidobacteria bacterium]|nr:hypothetical protein [Acidobacteriota bacterium]